MNILNIFGWGFIIIAAWLLIFYFVALVIHNFTNIRDEVIPYAALFVALLVTGAVLLTIPFIIA